MNQMHASVLWHDGNFLPWEAGNTHLFSHGLNYASGCFEGIRSFDTQSGVALFRAHDHLERFFSGMEQLGLSVPFSLEDILEVIKQLIKRNQLKNAYIRPIAFWCNQTPFIYETDFKTSIAVMACPFEGFFNREKKKRGLRIMTSSFKRTHSETTLTQVKASGHYLNSSLAMRQAKMKGYDNVLMLDTQGFIAEASAQNIFWLENDNQLCTPSTAYCLKGITRDTLIQLASKKGIQCLEGDFKSDRLTQAQAAFLTGTASGVVSIVSVDDHVISKQLYDLMEDLAQNYEAATTGRDSDFLDWLTWV